ncbi:MAG: cyclic nucleotide-binding domain-containing protein [Caldilineaceae bacterium]
MFKWFAHKMNILTFLKETVQSIHFNAGDTVLKQGQQGEYMYVIQQGELDVQIDGAHVRSMGPGDIFGEMAMVDGLPHSADIIAKTACVLAPIDERRFLFLVHENPVFALEIMRILTRRLRN